MIARKVALERTLSLNPPTHSFHSPHRRWTTRAAYIAGVIYQAGDELSRDGIHQSQRFYPRQLLCCWIIMQCTQDCLCKSNSCYELLAIGSVQNKRWKTGCVSHTNLIRHEPHHQQQRTNDHRLQKQTQSSTSAKWDFLGDYLCAIIFFV